MDIKIIDEMIEELEESDTTYANANDLAALYAVKKQLTQPEEIVTQELNEILPAYSKYVQTKRLYQLNKTTEDDVLIQMNWVCVEIKEFIQTLYSSTDMQEERDKIKEFIVFLYTDLQ